MTTDLLARKKPLTVPLFRARAKLGEKEKSLLTIDEVFDYLDDANLLVAQHFLLELMKQFKDAGKSIYVVILTHLNPSQFKASGSGSSIPLIFHRWRMGPKRDACIRFLSIGEGIKKSSSIFTRRYLRITCIFPIARRCPKMFEHMLRGK